MISNYNRLFADPRGKELFRKAFTSATNVGEGLIAEHLETILTNTLVRLVPELALPEYDNAPMKVYSYNKINSLPVAGSVMGENSTTPTRQSAISRETVNLKIMKRKGSVTGFLQDAASKEYNAEAVEIENHLQAFGNDMATYLLYGNAGADTYSFSGLDRFISTTRTNTAQGGTVPTNLNALDTMIDASNRRKGQPHRRAFIMSPEMLTKLSSLYTNVRDNRPSIREGTNVVQIDGGWILQTYRNIPILESSQTRPQGTMTTVTAAHAGSGSGIPDDTRYFRVAPVTWDGEQAASVEVSDTSSSSDTITLSWTAYTGAMFYKIYAADTTGQTTLVDIISAFTYDGNGTITGNTTSKVFTTEPLTPNATAVPTHMQSDVPYDYNSGNPMENIFLWDLDPHQGMGKVAYTNSGGSRLSGLVTMEPLAKIDDTSDFLLKSYPALIDSFEATSGMYRGLRTA